MLATVIKKILVIFIFREGSLKVLFELILLVFEILNDVGKTLEVNLEEFFGNVLEGAIVSDGNGDDDMDDDGEVYIISGDTTREYNKHYINPLSPHDALKHHFTSLKTNLIFQKLWVLERKFP